MPVAVVTGASRGIGLEFVREYADAGWHVFALCRDPAGAAALQAVVAEFGALVTTLAFDARDVEAPAKVAAALGPMLPASGIDVLVNNAGVWGGEHQSLGDLDVAAWHETFQVNVVAPLKLAEALVGYIEKSEYRCVANITSRMGSIGDNTSGTFYSYRSTKAALNAATKSLAIDLAGRKVAAIVLHPGWVKTDMGGENAMIDAEESVEGMRKVIEGLRPDDSGKFFAFDGRELPW